MRVMGRSFSWPICRMWCTASRGVVLKRMRNASWFASINCLECFNQRGKPGERSQYFMWHEMIGLRTLILETSHPVHLPISILLWGRTCRGLRGELEQALHTHKNYKTPSSLRSQNTRRPSSTTSTVDFNISLSDYWGNIIGTSPSHQDEIIILLDNGTTRFLNDNVVMNLAELGCKLKVCSF